MINTFVMSGEVKRVDVNNKPTKKGPAAVIVLQYGPMRERTDQQMQFLSVALVRVPPFVYERCKDGLKVGAMVDVIGHTQGILKQISKDGYVTNELVADRLQVVSDETFDDEGQDAALPDEQTADQILSCRVLSLHVPSRRIRLGLRDPKTDAEVEIGVFAAPSSVELTEELIDTLVQVRFKPGDLKEGTWIPVGWTIGDGPQGADADVIPAWWSPT